MTVLVIQPGGPVSTPPANDVKWDAYSSTTKTWCRGIIARTWFAARAHAMQKLGCGPGEVTVELAKENG